MIEIKFAVIKDDQRLTFTQWFKKYEDAKKEAERLCKKEKKRFFIVQLLAICEIDTLPIKWQRIGEL